MALNHLVMIIHRITGNISFTYNQAVHIAICKGYYYFSANHRLRVNNSLCLQLLKIYAPKCSGVATSSVTTKQLIMKGNSVFVKQFLKAP